ncbi:MAG: RNA 2',3'-cyclic phosphodiesterase [Candidatus Omnitrophota bacterium]
MRTFIAIELSEEIKDSLAQVQSHLKYAGADVKWVEKNNIHLTLKFLGEIDEKLCADVKVALDTIAKDTQPFEISLKDIGMFPRVIWVGLDKGAKESTELAKKIDLSLSKLGFQEETRAFTAHLTIGRVRSPKNKQALKEKAKSCRERDVAGQEIFPGKVKGQEIIKSVILFRSKLTPAGPVYTKLYETKFTC